ncbi:WD40-repeat-containing domain protein [Lanmaoa asiatica]|nr:WD40-repeat-containing domain protein [Lanmaoa asiatica]
MDVSQARGTDGTSPQPLVLSGHTRMVYSIAFLPDGDQFVSGSTDQTVRTWGTNQGCEIRSPIETGGIVSTVIVSNDGRWIATAGENWRVTFWDAKTHEKVGESANIGVIESLSFSSDAAKVASGLGDTTVFVWGVPTGEKLAGPFRGHTDAVSSVVFSPDGDRLASTDLHDVRIRDSHSGTLVLPLIELEVWSLAWAPVPNDRLIYAACDNRIKCIDTSTGAVCLEWTAHILTITSIALSRDGHLIASSSNYAKTVQLWSTTTQQEYMPPLQHASFVRCTAISPDGSHVISGVEDSAVYIWPIQGNLARVEEPASQSTIEIVAIDNDDNPEGITTNLGISTSLQGEGPDLNTEKRFPNDLTNQITRDGHDPVASGGFADIYRGIFRENGESIKVAIKAIKTYSGEDDGFAKKQKVMHRSFPSGPAISHLSSHGRLTSRFSQRLRREIKVWLNLKHVSVLPLLGTTMGFGRFPAMVCPWVENGALTSYLEDRHDSLSVVEILGLLNNVASGLQYLHSRSVVHGDLSGSNVLIRENGRAYIADFGLSMLLTELGGSTFATSFHARGTLRWTAPELLDLEVPEDGMEEESATR